MKKNDTLQDKINQSLSRFKDKIAVEYGGRALSYSQLDRQTNYVANWLIGQGIEKEIFIGVLIHDRMDFISSMIGILKAGCVFVPLDPALPRERLAVMIDSTDTKYILIDKAHADEWSIHHAVENRERKFIPIEQLFSHTEGQNLQGKASWFDNPVDVGCTREDKIYIYFTSGSTGRPKAILGRNKSLLHFIDWEIETICKNEPFRVSQFTTPGFDAFLRDVLVPLCSGGMVCIPGDIHKRLDPDELVAWIDRSRIQLIHCVPRVFRMLSSNNLGRHNLKTLKYILLSGEKVNPQDLVPWFNLFNGRIQLVNLWGTSETTLAKTAYFIQESDIHRERIPVGKPIKGTRVVVLNENMEICKPGIVGDLYIRTPYRTFGYYNDPGLNRERFIPNPFNSDPNDLLHKTGDLGRVLPDGNLDVLGRNDRQVKILGIRVELEEIESSIVKYPPIKEAVVIKKELAKNNEVLCAFVTQEETGEMKTDNLGEDLRAYLLRQLPDYMVPARIIKIKKIPVTPGGKINYQWLQGWSIDQAMNHTPPGDEIEKKLAEIWSNMLGIEKIGVTTRFFTLGGNSLIIMSLISKIHKEFDVRIPLGDIFNHPTIEQQAAIIKGAKKDKYASLELVEKKEYYALSSAQKRMYILYRMEPGSRVYNMPRTMVLEGNIHKERLEETFIKLIQRHESFRTSFEMLEGTPVQRIYREVPFGIDYFEAEQEEADQILNRYISPFDLSRPPLLRVGLIKIGETRHILMMEMHHIISDGVSLVLMEKDFMALYRGGQLPVLRLRYKDFSQWRNNPGEKEALMHQEAFWIKEFEDNIPVLNLPTDYARPLVRSFEGNQTKIIMEAQQWKQLKTLVLKEEITMYMVLLAIFNVLLAKLSGQEDIVVGTGVEGRRHEDLRPIIGMFVNTLSLRNHPQKDKTFIEFLGEVKERTLAAFENQDYQFEDLVEKVVVNRDTGRNPLFDVSFQVENIQAPAAAPASTGIRVMPHGYERKISRFDLTLRAAETTDGLLLSIEYNTSLFKENTIERFLMYFTRIVYAVVSAPGKKLSAIEMIPGKAKKELLFQLNEALENEVKNIHNKPYKTIQDKLNPALHLSKDHIAIAYGNRHLTYSQLDKRSNYIARRIYRKGITTQAFIGIMMNDRMELTASLLGILKAGCVFIPLDPDQPGDRLEMMIRSLDLKYIITDSANFLQRWQPGFKEEHNPELILIEELSGPAGGLTRELSWYSNRDEDMNRPGIQYGSEDQIYVYFTSGTTGTPRAMVGKNHSLLHFIDWEIETFGIKQDDRVSQLTNPGFDAFLRDVFVPLCSGGVICIPENKEILMDSEALSHWVQKSRIRLIHCVPSLFRLLSSATYLTNHHFKGLNHVLLSGESIHPSDLVRWYEIFDERIQLVNLWGTSETTLAKTCHFLRKSDIQRERIPVGQPIPGARLVILDSGMNLCPGLLTGEIYIITPFRTLGYCNDPGLTDHRFLPNPFNDNPQVRMHKTGDLGRLLPGGNLDVLGRNDRQVKIRGIRVELEEIESLLVRHRWVKEAVVVKQEISAGSEVLWGYVVVKDSGIGEIYEESSITELEDYLAAKLPAYMVPANITVMEKLPRTSRGKVDYDALPDPLAQNRANYVPPRDELEKSLCLMWSEILRIDIETIGITHRFFELAGNSLNAMALISKIHKEFNIKITMFQIFNSPTIKKQAEIIKKSEREQYLIIENSELKEYYELSPAQKRIYFMQQWNSKIVSYNMSEVVQLEGKLDKEKLEKTFMELIRRHESFRTSFDLIEERPVQRIHRVDEVKFTIEYFEIFSSNHPAPHSSGGIINDIVRPFDLSCAPLLRVGLIETAGDKYLLVVDMHHTISDGISREIFIREAMSLYRGDELPGLRLQYKDFSQWQTRQKECGILKRQEEYWLKVFEGDIPVLDLPTDFKRPFLQSFTGSRLQFEIDSDKVKILKEMAVAENVTMFIVLLAIFNILLSKLSGQQDIIIGTVITGRTHEDLNNITGMFVNTLALRNFAAKDMTFKEFLVSVRERTLNVFDNQDYPFEELVDKMELYRTADRNPLFSITFDEIEWEGNRSGDHPGQYKNGSTPPLLKLKPYGYDKEISKFDLMLRRIVLEDRLLFNMVYCTKLFKRETIEKFIKYFKEIVSSVVENNEIKLGEISISHDLLTVQSNHLEDYQRDFVF